MPPNPASGVALRPIVDADLDIFFRFMSDPGAVKMAAFTVEDPRDRSAFDAHWVHIRSLASVTLLTVTVYGEIAGNIGSYEEDDRRQVTYWIGRPFWGAGVATAALRLFLDVETNRPIFARVAANNLRSIHVLEANGFVATGTADAFAPGIGQIVEEVSFVLGT